MGFRLSSFVGGMAKGFSEQIEKQEELNTKQIQDNIKSMYLGYAEQKNYCYICFTQSNCNQLHCSFQFLRLSYFNV